MKCNYLSTKAFSYVEGQNQCEFAYGMQGKSQPEVRNLKSIKPEFVWVGGLTESSQDIERSSRIYEGKN